MVIKTALATMSLLALSDLPSLAQARNWLAPVPDTKTTISADALTFSDPTINFGSHARVRVYRPDGVYDIDNSAITMPPAVDVDTKAEPTPR